LIKEISKKFNKYIGWGLVGIWMVSTVEDVLTLYNKKVSSRELYAHPVK
jgi:hypothetical protein